MKKYKNRNLMLLVSLVLAFTVLAAGCGQNSAESVSENETTGNETAAEKVTVMLDWYPNTNHTGLYVAAEKGFYEEQGLEVEIVQPGEGNTGEQLVAAGKAHFAIAAQESVTQARANDIPLVSIAAIIQHNTSGFASLKEDGIESVKDFEGKTYGGWGSPVEEAVLKAVMENEGADFSKLNIVTLGATDFFNSIGRDSDFQWIYYGWDGVEAERRGIELNLLMLKDLDPALDYYTPVIITGEKQIAEQPELVKKFMAATANGYEFAIQNPAESADILLKHAPELNGDLVHASQKWLSEQYQADASQWGWQEREVWERYARWMYERELIPKMIEADKAFTTEFLPGK